MTNKNQSLNRSLKVACPHCKADFYYYQVETRPFCSPACQNRDFLKWTQEEHRIPSQKSLSEQDLEFVINEREKGEDDF